jgi:DNA polymerase elongation subunit (family B)
MKLIIYIQSMTKINEKRVIVPVISGMPLMGQKLSLKDINKFPTNAYFCNKSSFDQVEETIRLNSGIIFHTIKMSVEQWNWKHYLLIHGRGEDGRVMILVIKDTFPVIHVRKPDNIDPEQFMASLKRAISEFKIPSQPTFILAKRLVYYELEKTQYAKINCNNLRDYSAIIEKLTVHMGWTVADTKYPIKRFYLQNCRQNDIATAGFNEFKFISRGNANYRQYLQPDIEEVFEVSINDIKKFDIKSVDPPRLSLIQPHITDLNFDLETGSRVFNKATDASREDTHCNIIGMTLRLNKCDLFRVALTTSPHSLPNDGYVLFYCKNELEMFIVFANIIKKLRPAFISGYNIDDFDWRFIVTKLLKYEAVGMFFALIDFVIRDFSWIKKKESSTMRYNESLSRQYMNSRVIKISAEEKNCQTYYPELLSFINFDIFNMLRKKHPSGKFSPKSLNFFLNQYGLPSKFDMDYPTMHSIYNEQYDIKAETIELSDSHISRITDEVTYCIFDTISALDLTDASGIFHKIIILAHLNKCTLHEPIYYAIGSIVMENLINIAYSKGYLKGNEKTNTDQLISFTGGLVINPPHRGLSKPKLTAAQRILLLPEWSEVTQQQLSKIEEAHLKSICDPVEFLIINYADTIPSHILELVKKMVDEGHETPMISFDFSSQYPTIMAENNLSPETQIKPGEEKKMVDAGIELRFVDRTVGNVKIQTHFVLNNGGRADKGITPVAQYNLLQERNVKKSNLKESLKILRSMDSKDDTVTYNLQKAKCEMLDMEQLECKIAMNTYYGKFGDKHNDLYNLAIVTDTTLTARENLLMLIDICNKFGCIFQYGDTDSAYVQIPWIKYKDIISQYYGGKIDIREYYEQIIKRTYQEGAILEKHINLEFRKARKPFSTVELERVGFPKMNIRCKKYALSSHSATKSSIKEDGSSEIYMVGIAKKKAKSTSGLFQLLTNMAIEKIFNIYNTDSMKKIMTVLITDIFRKMRDHDVDPVLFIKIGMYKPDKKNICMNNFIARLIKEGRTPPRPYEKFEYAFVQRDDIAFNMYGNNGDKGGSLTIELYSEIIKNKWSFNFMKYMEGEIIAELGQYMCCDQEFIVHPIDSSDNAKHDAEDATSLNGYKFIEMLCKNASSAMDIKIARPVYTKIFNRLSNHTSNVLKYKHNIKESSIKLIAESVKKETALFIIYNNIIDKAVKKNKNVIYKILVDNVNKDIKKIFKINAQENSKLCSKNIYMNSMSIKNQQDITQLNIICREIDEFCKKYNEYIVKQNSSIRNGLGLNKRVICPDDIKSAEDLFNSYKLDDTNFVPPSNSLFEECDKLVKNIIKYDSNIHAFDMYKNYISNIVSDYGKGGIVINNDNIVNIISDAINTINLPSDLYNV